VDDGPVRRQRVALPEEVAGAGVPTLVQPVPTAIDPAEPHPSSNGNGLYKALVLNATMEPLCVVAARRAVVLVLSAKADVIAANGHRFRSEHIDMQAPSIIRLRAYVRVPYRRRAALSRRGVFIRDQHTCQYCGVPAENVDHVVPRSRGGAHEWENVVAACRRCNSRKKDRTPGEASMSLARTPFAPRAAFWLIVAVGGVDPDWDVYLGDALTAG
jgi:5-methylcytosine-specific restriction endonuclease McrA